MSKVDELKRIIENATRIVAFPGGLALTESGIPTSARPAVYGPACG